MPDDTEIIIDLTQLQPQLQVQYPIFGVDILLIYACLVIHFSAGYFTCQEIYIYGH